MPDFDKIINSLEWNTVGELMTWANSRGMDVEEDNEGGLLIYTNLAADEHESLIPVEMIAE